MANATLPPDANELEKQDYNRWLDSAISSLRSSEIEGTFDNLSAILTSRAYVSMSTTEEGYPSPSAFMSAAPELRKERLSRIMRSPDKLEEGMIAFLDNLSEDEPGFALALVGDLSRGGTSADFKAQLARVAEKAKKAQAEIEREHQASHDFSPLKKMKTSILVPESPLKKMKKSSIVVPHEVKAKADTEDSPEPGRPGRRPKKVSRMGQNPGDDIFITERKS